MSHILQSSYSNVCFEAHTQLWPGVLNTSPRERQVQLSGVNDIGEELRQPWPTRCSQLLSCEADDLLLGFKGKGFKFGIIGLIFNMKFITINLINLHSCFHLRFVRH